MKVTLSYEGNLYEDNDTIKVLTHSREIYLSLTCAREMIRQYLKHAENITDNERHLLEKLNDALWVEGINL